VKANRTFNVRARPLDLVLEKPELWPDGKRFILFLSAAFRDGRDRHLRISLTDAERRELGILLMRGEHRP